MIHGIGCDIVEIFRIQGLCETPAKETLFLKRVFTEHEIDYFQQYNDSIPQITGHFAAKEAIAKALGTGFRDSVTWQAIEIQHDTLGKPYVVLNDEIRSQFQDPHIHISISHGRDYAFAVAIWDREPI